MPKHLFIYWGCFAWWLLTFPTATFAQDWKYCNKQAEKNYAAGKLQQAIFWAEKATNEIENKFGLQNPDYSFVLDNLAKLYVETGQYERAEQLYTEIRNTRLAVLGSNHLDYATALDNLALVYQLMGAYHKAAPILLISKQIREQNASTLHPDYAHTLDNLAFLYEQLGLYEKAENFYWQAKEIKAKVLGKKSTDYANTLYSFAELYALQAQYDKAEALYDECLKITQKIEGKQSMGYATALDGLAALYVKQKKYAEAKPLLAASMQITEQLYGTAHPDYALNINTLAYINSKEKDYEQAEKLYRQSLAILEKALGKHHIYYTNTLFSLAVFQEEQGNWAAAESYYRLVLDKKQEEITKLFPVLSEAEKLSFYKNIKQFFNTFHSFALKYSKEKPTILCKVFENQLLIKGLLFDNSQRQRHAILQSKDSTLTNLYFRLKEQKEKLAAIFYTDTKTFRATEQQKLIQTKETVEQEVETTEKLLAGELQKKGLQSIDNQNFIDWKSYQSQLQVNEVLVELVRVPNEQNPESLAYLALIMTPETKEAPIALLLSNGNTLEGSALKFYQYSLLDQRTDHESYQHYWLPIRKVIEVFTQNQRQPKVYICPDGVYHQINLHSLLNVETGNYLIDEQPLTLLTNSKDLLQQADKQANKLTNNLTNNLAMTIDNALLLGCPAYDLPAVVTELQAIDTLLRSNKKISTVLLNEKATKQVLKNLQPTSLLHIATHGFFGKLPTFGGESLAATTTEVANSTHPLLHCGLILGKPNPNETVNENTEKNKDKNEEKNGNETAKANETADQILTAYEAMNLPLTQTQLVVLSACETGRGEIHEGEGIYGLQRAFLVAGTHTLLMSLWKVNDRATQLLMTHFYENLLTHQLSPALALQDAQKKLREKYAHPYFWAAFVVVNR